MKIPPHLVQMLITHLCRYQEFSQNFYHILKKLKTETKCIYFQLTELKADNFEFDNTMRKKITSMQKTHTEQMENMQVKTNTIERTRVVSKVG